MVERHANVDLSETKSVTSYTTNSVNTYILGLMGGCQRTHGTHRNTMALSWGHTYSCKFAKEDSRFPVDHNNSVSMGIQPLVIKHGNGKKPSLTTCSLNFEKTSGMGQNLLIHINPKIT